VDSGAGTQNSESVAAQSAAAAAPSLSTPRCAATAGPGGAGLGAGWRLQGGDSDASRRWLSSSSRVGLRLQSQPIIRGKESCAASPRIVLSRV
jgi:hypothetical protein